MGLQKKLVDAGTSQVAPARVDEETGTVVVTIEGRHGTEMIGTNVRVVGTHEEEGLLTLGFRVMIDETSALVLTPDDLG